MRSQKKEEDDDGVGEKEEEEEMVKSGCRNEMLLFPALLFK